MLSKIKRIANGVYANTFFQELSIETAVLAGRELKTVRGIICQLQDIENYW